MTHPETKASDEAANCPKCQSKEISQMGERPNILICHDIRCQYAWDSEVPIDPGLLNLSEVALQHIVMLERSLNSNLHEEIETLRQYVRDETNKSNALIAELEALKEHRGES